MTGPEPASGPETLDPSECWSLLRTTPVGRLAVGEAGDIDIFPINFTVDGGTIVFRTAPGTKLTRLRSSTAVTFEADEVDADRHVAWSVVIKGSAHQIRLAEELDGTTALPLYPYEKSTKGVFVRIEPAAITGRRFAITDRERWHLPGVGQRAPKE